jgi:hypothetical protein
MGSRYRYVRSEGQEDKNACWAACLVWWLRATNKKRMEQWELMSSDEYSDLWFKLDQGGTISEDGLKKIMTDTRWEMTHQKLELGSQLDYGVINAHLNFGPIYIGYNDVVVGGNHVNIIYDVHGNESYPQVSVMEPAYRKKADGTFKGKHLTRGLTYYRAPGVVYLASPTHPISLDRK